MTCFEAHVTNEHVFISCNMQQIPSEASSNSTVKKRGIRGPNPNNYKKRLSSPYRPHSLWCPSSTLISGRRNASLETQRPERDVDHSPPNAKINSEWSCIMSVPIWLVGMERDVIFTFLQSKIKLCRIQVCCAGHRVRQSPEVKCCAVC